MDEQRQEDWLDRQLREAVSYIDDEGFTAQVLKRLPARRPGRRPLRAVILLRARECHRLLYFRWRAFCYAQCRTSGDVAGAMAFRDRAWQRSLGDDARAFRCDI